MIAAHAQAPSPPRCGSEYRGTMTSGERVGVRGTPVNDHSGPLSLTLSPAGMSVLNSLPNAGERGLLADTEALAPTNHRSPQRPPTEFRLKPQLSRYRNCHCFHIVKHVLICKPQHAPPFVFKERLPRAIGRFNTLVVAAVDLDDALQFRASKIREERPDGMLPSKLQAADPFCTEHLPEKRFCPCLSLAKVAGSVSAIGHLTAPLPRPLPRGKREPVPFRIRRVFSVTIPASSNADAERQMCPGR